MAGIKTGPKIVRKIVNQKLHNNARLLVTSLVGRQMSVDGEQHSCKAELLLKLPLWRTLNSK